MINLEVWFLLALVLSLVARPSEVLSRQTNQNRAIVGGHYDYRP